MFSPRLLRILGLLALLQQPLTAQPVSEAASCVPGQVLTIAGGNNGTAYGYADGVGSAALFHAPYSVAIDGRDTLYVADASNHLIRAIDASSGAVSTVAGGGGAGLARSGRADGVGSAATFFQPQAVAIDAAAPVVAIYVADAYNNLVRTVINGLVTTLAGGGGAGGTAAGFVDGLGSAARFNNPTGIAAMAGTVFVADSSNHLLRAIVADTGAVSTLAGGGSAGGRARGLADGVGSAATFNSLAAVSADGAGTLYIADTYNNLVRAVDAASGAVRTLAGGGCAGCSYSGFVDGLGSAARFAFPTGIAADGSFVYVGDTSNHVIRAITIATGAVMTLAGGGSGGGTQSGCADGVGTAALLTGKGLGLRLISGSAASTGSLITADFTNHRVRAICALAPPPPPPPPPPSPAPLPPAPPAASPTPVASALPDAREGDIATPLFGAAAALAACAALGAAVVLWRRRRYDGYRRRAILQSIYPAARDFADISPVHTIMPADSSRARAEEREVCGEHSEPGLP